MMVIVLFFSGYSIGKGIFETDIKTIAKIAKPILIVDNSPTINITSLNNMGNYEFKIRNYDNNQEITQTTLKYDIEIISNIKDFIKVRLYKDGKEIIVKDNKTQDIFFYANIKEEHNYRLEIIYEKEKDNSIEDIIQSIQLKVHSEQVNI